MKNSIHLFHDLLFNSKEKSYFYCKIHKVRGDIVNASKFSRTVIKGKKN